jgi:hypothetical protein
MKTTEYTPESPKPFAMFAFYDSHGLPGLIDSGKLTNAHQLCLVLPADLAAQIRRLAVAVKRSHDQYDPKRVLVEIEPLAALLKAIDQGTACLTK